MAGGIVRRVRPAPNQPLRVNAGHPLAAGLALFGWAVGVNRVWDALTGRVIDLSASAGFTGTFIRGAGGNGPALRMAGGERGGGSLYNPTSATLGQGTLVARFKPSQATSGTTRPYVAVRHASSDRGLLVGMASSTSSHAYGVVSSSGWLLPGGSGVDEQVWRTVGVNVDPASAGNVQGWIEGKYVASTAYSGSAIGGEVPTRIWFGRDPTNYFGYPTGDVGWFGYWHRLLGAGEHRLLHEDPWSLVTPASLVQGWRFAAAAGGGDTALAGAATGSGTAAGALTAGIRLAGAGSGSGTASGGLTTGIALAGAPTGTGVAAGAITTGIRLASAPTGSGTAAAALSTGIALAGAGNGTGVAAGALEAGAAALDGGASATGVASAALTTSIRLAGGATGTGTAVAGLSVGSGLEGAAGGSGTASAALSTGIRLAVGANGGGVASGDLSTGIRLVASAAGTGTAAGALTTGIALAAAPTGGGTAAAALATGIRLVSAGNGVGTATGALTVNDMSLAADPRRTIRLRVPADWPVVPMWQTPRVRMGRIPRA